MKELYESPSVDIENLSSATPYGVIAAVGPVIVTVAIYLVAALVGAWGVYIAYPES